MANDDSGRLLTFAPGTKPELSVASDGGRWRGCEGCGSGCQLLKSLPGSPWLVLSETEVVPGLGQTQVRNQ
jgi:hypothetical protein